MFRFSKISFIQNFPVFIFTLLVSFSACSVHKEMTYRPDVSEEYLDTLVITPSFSGQKSQVKSHIYNSSATRAFDLVHTKLDVRFNWKAETVIGKAWLTLTPYFNPQYEIELDAVGFHFDSIGLSGYSLPLKTKYDNKKLTIHLPNRMYQGDTIEIYLSYVALPRPEEGSAEQGLFFINPLGLNPDQPRQIWTQGQPEYNSYWFPTIDKPNERCTQEISITVEDEFITISNGSLISSDDHGDGTRTDNWSLNIPHSPYLFMLAVGNFAVVEETWNDKKVSYYVDPEYGPFARQIFNNTIEMLEYFSLVLDYPFPWPKYDQIIVHDFLAGAMENTTAVIYNKYVQKDTRELIGNKNDYIVSHELFHHWFGNIVTCESWANLTLNEGFANYGTYLWEDYKYGKDASEYYRWLEWQGYIFQSLEEIHPLIHFYYKDKEEMFDNHTYNKGCLVLHMLRKLVGEHAFFTGIQTYLKMHQFSSTEIHDLRLTFEDITGFDLNWFFDQWFFSSGHPVINFSYDWNDPNNQLTVYVVQEQDPVASRPVFIFPTSLTLFWADSSHSFPIEINRRNQFFSLDCTSEPELVIMDDDKDILAIIKQDFTVEQLHRLYRSSGNLRNRHTAITNLRSADDPNSVSLKLEALTDSFWLVRNTSMNGIDWSEEPSYWDLLCHIAIHDPHPEVRINSIEILGDLGKKKHFDVISSCINQNEPYSIVSCAIENCFRIDAMATRDLMRSIEYENHSDIVLAIANVYSQTSDERYVPYFLNKTKIIADDRLEPFLDYALLFLEKLDSSFFLEFIKTMQQLIIDQNKSDTFRKIAGSHIIEEYHKVTNQEDKDYIQQLIFQMINHERDPSLQSFFLRLIR